MLNDFHTETTPAHATRGDSAIDPSDIETADVMTIQALRESRGLGVVELAGLAGLLPDHLRAIEAGVEPTTPERQAIAAALNVPIERLA